MKNLSLLLGIVLAGTVVSCARWRDDTTASDEQAIRAIYNRFKEGGVPT
jgi:hypothetical protein